MTTRVLYPGSFDPVHNGHIEIITTAAGLFDEVVVAAMRNPQKGGGHFDLETRQAMIRESIGHLGNVEVTMFSSLVVDLATEIGADFEIQVVYSGCFARCSPGETPQAKSLANVRCFDGDSFGATPLVEP